MVQQQWISTKWKLGNFFFLGKRLGSILVAEKAYLLVRNDSSGNIVVGIFLVS